MDVGGNLVESREARRFHEEGQGMVVIERAECLTTHGRSAVPFSGYER